MADCRQEKGGGGHRRNQLPEPCLREWGPTLAIDNGKPEKESQRFCDYKMQKAGVHEKLWLI